MPAERLRDLELEVTAQIWMGPGAHFVHYFVQQRKLVNFVAIFDQADWTRESWTDRGDVADALAAFEAWHLQIQAIIGAVHETFIWALFERPPLPRWSSGRVTLLGDACHAMLPFMAQGAAQGLEDARRSHGGRIDRLRAQGSRVDLRPRRRPDLARSPRPGLDGATTAR